MPVLSIQINNIATMGNQFQQNYLLKNEYFIKNIMNGFLNGMDSTFIGKKIYDCNTSTSKNYLY